MYIYKVKFLNNSHCDIFNITYKLCYLKQDNIKLLFQVTAKHSIFNTMKQFQQIYSYTDIVEGEFCVGNSMKIV